MNTLPCPFCGGVATLQPGDRVWPGKGLPKLWVCENFPRCDAYVRCHEGSDRPLGTLANKRLRRLRTLAHQTFDPLWQDLGHDLGRTSAYEAAAFAMGVQGEFHIGNLNAEQCEHFIRHIDLVEMEMEKRLQLNHQRLQGPSELTIEVLQCLFNPDRDTYHSSIPLAKIAIYRTNWDEAVRFGLAVQEGLEVKLTRKGVAVIYDPLG